MNIDWSRCLHAVSHADYCNGLSAEGASAAADALHGNAIGAWTCAKHPRLPVMAIVDNWDDGESIATIAHMFVVDKQTVREVIDYALQQRRLPDGDD